VRKETGFPGLPILEVSIRSGVRRRDFDSGGRKQEMADRSKYQRALQGNIAYNMMRMWQGAVGVVPMDGLVSPAYVVARPYPQVDAGYFAYLFRTADYMREVEIYSRGIVPDRNRLYWDSFKQIFSPVPPVDEQRLIVRFLDTHAALTARVIRAKSRLIKLLEEQKQAIIHGAVTRGLDPNVRLKPSGLAWLGDIPAHWEVRQVREIARIINGFPFDSARFSNDRGHPLVRIRDLNKEKTETLFDGDLVAEATIMPGEVLIGMDGDFNVGSWNGKEPALLNQRMCCVRGRSTDLSGFLGFALRHRLKLINKVTWSTTVQHLASHQIERIKVAVPSDNERCSIIAYINQETDGLNRAISAIAHEIVLLREFRARLVADVVSGQLDVREPAAALPEIIESEPIDEPTDGNDLEEAIDDVENEQVAA
jgi:type I restriction enzyme S subunit